MIKPSLNPHPRSARESHALTRSDFPTQEDSEKVYKQINLYSGKDKMVILLAHSNSKSPSPVHLPQDVPHPGEVIYLQGSFGAHKVPAQPSQVLPCLPQLRYSPMGTWITAVLSWARKVSCHPLYCFDCTQGGLMPRHFSPKSLLRVFVSYTEIPVAMERAHRAV